MSNTASVHDIAVVYCYSNVALLWLQMLWTYVNGMLTNMESQSLERIHSMLKMFANTECSLLDLEHFLSTKIREGKLVCAAGVYKLAKWNSLLGQILSYMRSGRVQWASLPYESIHLTRCTLGFLYVQHSSRISWFIKTPPTYVYQCFYVFDFMSRPAVRSCAINKVSHKCSNYLWGARLWNFWNENILTINKNFDG